MQENIIESIDYKNHKIKIWADDSPPSPREWDNLGVMVHWHRDYDLGDERLRMSDYKSADEVLKALEEEHGPLAVVLPMFLYDHSGLRLSTGSFRAYDPGEWDSGQVGFIFATRAKVLKEFDVKKISKELKEKVTRALVSEVRAMDAYVSGNVLGFTIETPAGDLLESICGFYPDDTDGTRRDEFKYMKQEAESIIDATIEQARRKHQERLKAQIKAGAPLSVRVPLGVSI